MNGHIKKFRKHSYMLIINTKERNCFFETYEKKLFNEKFFDIFVTKIKELVSQIEEILPKTRIDQVKNLFIQK